MKTSPWVKFGRRLQHVRLSRPRKGFNVKQQILEKRVKTLENALGLLLTLCEGHGDFLNGVLTQPLEPGEMYSIARWKHDYTVAVINGCARVLEEKI